MENNHDIDKKFNEASKAEEPATFPGFDKVWAAVEEKLDKKEEKKRIIPVWFPYGIAASLIIGLGAFYFISKKENIEPVKPVIVENRTSPSPKIATIDSTIQSNIKKEIAEATVPNHKAGYADNTHPVKDILKENPSVHPEVATPRSSYAQREKERDTTKVENIEEVIVYGLGTKSYKKESITASMTTVFSSEISRKASSDVVSSLSGKVAGISISPGSGKDAAVRIRGSRSVSGVSSVLMIVDGVVSNADALRILDPKKIMEVQVLKGADATALYGSKASNGAIIVTTKGLSASEKAKIKELSDKKAEKITEPETELPKAGLLTAGEVNDFSKWNYWKDIAVPTLDQYKESWKFFPDRRVSVQLINKNKKPVVGEKIKLLNDKKEIVWEAVSDNLGNAELWINPMTDGASASTKYYLADHTGQIISANIREFKNGQNVIMLDKSCLAKRTLDLAFVVDATGSMGDEISYLQSELLDVLKKVESRLKNTDIRYGSVFYRDQGDEYVTRKFDFSDKAEDMVNFIKKQKAGGGGDTPEAVVEAMQVSVDELKWSNENSTKIMFLILDAPPHQSEENIKKLYDKIKLAAQKGITIIPLAASDTDKQTEYLMRTFALMTNGTYTFLTNDSGIGNNHIKPTIDSYEVEKLNDLLLRLILQRATLPECSNGISNEYLNKKMEKEVDSQVDSKVTIYPNPTKGLINIKSRKSIDELFVYDLAGKIIMRKENLKDDKTIDITSYPQSIYLLRMRFGDSWETFKVIKN